MDFDDLQVIWDSQKEQPMYVIDQQAVMSMVKQRGVAVERLVNCFELCMMAIVLTVGLAVISEPLIFGDDYHQLLTANLWFGVFVYLWLSRRKRRRAEVDFDRSVVGMIDKAIAQIDYKIRQLRTIGWWFIAPVMTGMSIGFFFLWDSKPVWVWPLTVGAFALTYWLMRREIWVHLIPQRKELESLRDKLIDCEEE